MGTSWELPQQQAELLEGQLRAARVRNRELTHEQHRVRHIVRMVSHDMRSPMQDLELVLSAAEDTPGHCLDERSLHVARHALSRMSRLLDDLMSSSRSRVPNMPLSLRPIDVATPVLDAVEPLRSRASSLGLLLSTDIPRINPPVQADADRLEQVITNLVVNALKFTPAPGSVRVAVRTCCEHASIRVADTGPGMIPEDVPRAFEPFWQKADGEQGGVGLGLAITRNIVRAHHGRVWLESEPGRGTAITFTLPLAL